MERTTRLTWNFPNADTSRDPGCEGPHPRIDCAHAIRPFGKIFTANRKLDFSEARELQMTGAFKERGALNKILMLTEEERRHGVIAASAGNHAQAVAYHATKRGIKAQICMPLTTPLVKVPPRAATAPK